MPHKIKHLLGLALALSSHNLFAADYEINTFLTIGGVTNTSNGAYLNQIDDTIGMEFDSKYGVNLRTQLSEDIEGASQLIANGRNGTFGLELEWAYVSYTLTENLRIRIGKLNLQTFLLSDYVEVGYLYPWVRPPEEVYGLNPMRNFPGVEIMHTSRFGQTSLTSQFFVGSAQVDISTATRFKAKSGIGANFQLDAPNFSLRIGGITPIVELAQSPTVSYRQAPIPTNPLAVEIDPTKPSFPGGVLNDKDRMYMFTLGYTFDINDFIGYGEYINVKAIDETSRIFPNQTGFYMTFGYQVDQYLPYFTIAGNRGTSNYAFLDNINTSADGFQPNPLVLQDSISLGLRYEVNDYSAVKFEFKNITPILDPDLVAAGFPTFNAGWSIGEPTDASYSLISLTYDMIF